VKTIARVHPTNPQTGAWLVLGATGFIGRAAAAEWTRRGSIVAGTARRNSAGASGGEDLAVLSLTDEAGVRSMLRRVKPSVVLNAVGHEPALPESALREFYVRTTTNLLVAIQAERPACRVLLLGSAAEYGNAPDATGSRETDALQPLTEYGRAKCEQFEVASRFAATGMEVITLRVFNVIGPGQGGRHLAGALIGRIRNGENPLVVRCGNYVRDWIDVRDVARALALVAESGSGELVVNVCTGRGRTVESLARGLERIAAVPVTAVPGPIGADQLWHSVGNPERLARLGWQPEIDFNQSLADQWAAGEPS
jgi:nucleoside-diphosphate-sugar epimerase